MTSAFSSTLANSSIRNWVKCEFSIKSLTAVVLFILSPCLAFTQALPLPVVPSRWVPLPERDQNNDLRYKFLSLARIVWGVHTGLTQHPTGWDPGSFRIVTLPDSMMAHHCIPIRMRKREGRTCSFLLKTSPSTLSMTFHLHALEKEMATHSSVLAWRVPGTAEPGGLPSMGSHRVGHDWSDLAVAAAVAISSTFNYFKEKLGKSILSQLSYTPGIKRLCLTHCIPNNTYLTWTS